MAQIDLEQYRLDFSDFCGFFFQFAGQRNAVNRVNQSEISNRFARFVRLQGADQMPGWAEVLRGEGADFGQGFLDVIFPEIS